MRNKTSGRRWPRFGSWATFWLLGALPALSNASPQRTIDACTPQQKLAFTPQESDVPGHRHFTVPTITYPFGTQLSFAWGWGFDLDIRVDEQGSVVCYLDQDRVEDRLQLNDQRREAIQTLASLVYAPFLLNSTAVPAIVTEHISEEEAPEEHRDLPTVPLDQVRVSLERTACYGTCPAYRVELLGNGNALYEGFRYVAVTGKHLYHVDPAKVAALIASARAKNLGSLRKEYRYPVTDNPTYAITLRLGSETHQIVDYVGHRVGMPQDVTTFENEIDAAANSTAWIHLDLSAVDALDAEHFPFQSPQGGALLMRAIADGDAHDNGAILQLIRLGAPWNVQLEQTDMFSPAPGSALEDALESQRDAVVDVLLAQGALKDRHTIDQQKLDAAFRAAIVGGRLTLVQKIWDAGGSEVHPALTFEDVSDDTEPRVKKRVPVTLLLSRSFDKHKPWEGLQITQWLVAKGADIQARGADGRTLLHIAAEANDIDLVRYTLAQGIPPSTAGKFKLPALDSTTDEDVALVLLQADTHISKSTHGRTDFRHYALERHWARVIAWLDAHH